MLNIDLTFWLFYWVGNVSSSSGYLLSGVAIAISFSVTLLAVLLDLLLIWKNNLLV